MKILTIVLTLALTAPASAQNMTPAKALASLSGEWVGALQYRDYQSDTLEEIPLASDFQPAGDGQSVYQLTRYTDPGFDVFIATLHSVTDESLTSAISRKGRPFELLNQTVTMAKAGAEDHDWVMVTERIGLDDDRSARIRETWTRSGDTLRTVKEVDYLDEDTEFFEYRNSHRYERERSED
ncbi:MAG: hypothetical protein AAGD40_04770 [Pseudomonadota bacterium]